MVLEFKNLTNKPFENGRSISEISKEELYHRIYQDRITGYYNWTYLWKFLDKRYRDDTPFCFAHFNIKDMKMVNDIYGHEAANDLLISICNALEEERRAGWVLQACRCDNDNFSVMLKVLPEEELTQKLTEFFEKVSCLPCNHNYKIYYRCGVESETRENYLIKDIITMSKHLGFVCLAEGSENKEQVDFLRSAGCEKIQGFYYSKPVPESEFLDKIRTN